jgi:hypothetical protein
MSVVSWETRCDCGCGRMAYYTSRDGYQFHSPVCESSFSVKKEGSHARVPELRA